MTTVSLTGVLLGLAAAITTYVSPLTSEGRVASFSVHR